MGDNYKPKKMVAIYDLHKKEMECPNCKQVMGYQKRTDCYVAYCFNEACKLFDVKYRAVKSLVTLERVDG